MKMESFALETKGWSNPRLPARVYRDVLKPATAEETASALEKMFRKNGWPPQWRNGIYNYHHFHSTAHEVLGIAAGSARLKIGGPDGEEVSVKAGDVVVLPAGTGHCRLDADADFLVVGAYPSGQDWDICRAAAEGDVSRRIARVPEPESDPVDV